MKHTKPHTSSFLPPTSCIKVSYNLRLNRFNIDETPITKEEAHFSMKKLCSRFLSILLFWLALSPALAGSNPMTVAVSGKGITVYSSSGGGSAVGLLYNGFSRELSLEPKNGLHSCNLTSQYTVWLNQKKAMAKLPKGWDSGSLTGEELDAQMPSGLFLAEVAVENAPLYTTPGHKHLTARHAPGTLALVCGEFGDDYYVSGGIGMEGFMPKASLKKFKAVSFSQAWYGNSYGLSTEKKTVYSGGGVLFPAGSATGYSDAYSYWQLQDGQEVEVLREVNGWAQLVFGGFIESRFLDPQGDHSREYAYVYSDKPLNRLNLRSSASAEAGAVMKLCAGAPVQVVSRSQDWATVFMTGPSGGEVVSGCVQTQYLSSSAASQPNGCVRARLKAAVSGNYNRYRISWHGEDTLPAGTEMTIIGVKANFNADENDSDVFYALLDDGRLVSIWDDSGLFQPLDPLDVTAKTASSVRFRVSPDKTSMTIRTLSSGTKVQVLLRGEGWTMIRYKNETGYVMSRYLQFP